MCVNLYASHFLMHLITIDNETFVNCPHPGPVAQTQAFVPVGMYFGWVWGEVDMGGASLGMDIGGEEGGDVWLPG